jgi:hypothetical protein
MKAFITFIYTFNHLFNAKSLNSFLNLIKSPSKSFHPFILYFKQIFIFYKNIKHNFEELYNIKDSYENDLDALHSRTGVGNLFMYRGRMEIFRP